MWCTVAHSVEQPIQLRGLGSSPVLIHQSSPHLVVLGHCIHDLDGGVYFSMNRLYATIAAWLNSSQIGQVVFV